MSPFTRLYYTAKPFLPRTLRNGLRRAHARRVRRQSASVWPVLPGSERPPAGWQGWPDGKQFAVVLTHDVEGQSGYDQILRLAALEKEMGFRSSFNLIPEGPYSVAPELRAKLQADGFEVGIHDLHHDGKLYRSHERFSRLARRINHYVQAWDVVGFRSAYMHHNLEWLGELEVAYDASTFDTDPFEPQPDGVGTIFPFWVPRSPSLSSSSSNSSALRLPHSALDPSSSSNSSAFRVPHSELDPVADHDLPSAICHLPSPAGSAPLSAFSSPLLKDGFVELPYTLVQDSTLFLYLGDQNIDCWKWKVDWIARHGGMVLLNVHPDYLDFSNGHTSTRFPVSYYAGLLDYIRSRYQGQFWHARPCELVSFCSENLSRDSSPRSPGLPVAVDVSFESPQRRASTETMPTRPRVWIDLENTPHAPFFKPVIRELETRGYSVSVTARDGYQTCEMASKLGLVYSKVGHHYGKSAAWKFWGLFSRTLLLLPRALRMSPALAVNHYSRSQMFAAALLRIPTVTIIDYEHSQHFPPLGELWEIIPQAVNRSSMGLPANRVLTFNGLKEDVYVPDFRPDPTIYRRLGLNPDLILVTVRPPATQAHYHNPESEGLLEAVMEKVLSTPSAQCVLLPRNRDQELELRARWPHWFTNARIIVPRQVEEGLNLIWHSDLVVSGGGTMNREAAALRVPVYSIFRGRLGAVDRWLADQQRLVLLTSPADVLERITFTRRSKILDPDSLHRPALADIVGHLEYFLQRESPADAGDPALHS